ncbi:bifunctional ADP-dependent NAD(P)H-hydrate dehydratase/NAD(P)H-hydrate epimerase [Cellulomonas composti]|uniref:Bifunctional NAD(P)H-hydrate repair enzyme n=1 Tax=Cellulomonas composti TaxID=266130 RepID=A0A511J9V7_9CELL|nr:bifunctional ADP-dependent NAD(P)H-hydrate dehydratase/NAD(P)H-hydrate epimerase [Cellulomonas composti]GEL94483.1 bifunctional NAD(P)H-hydrate repair enzyme [Cellulomonas composti]
MLLSWTAEQVRAAERPLLTAGAPLMERASFALALAVVRILRERRGRVRGARVALLVGPGNNGGDALYAGAFLRARGVEVTAVCVASRLHDEGARALVAAGGRLLRPGPDEPATDEPVADEHAVLDAALVLQRADVVLDGVLGTGGRGGGLGGVAAAVVERFVGLVAAAGAGPAVVAVDVPSGVGVDDGTLTGTVLDAELTVTFGGAKPALLLPPAAGAAGRVEVVDIGLDLSGERPAVARLEPADVAALWPRPGTGSQKYSRGVLGVVAGSRRYPGAAVLATDAAVLAGVGMVRYLGAVGEQVVAHRPEVVLGEGRVQAWALGPGVPPDDDAQRARIQGALAGGEPAVVDAGALAALPERVGPHVVLTPHAGELATLLTTRGVPVRREDVEAEPLRRAREAHELTGATVLLKGHVTLVVGPDDAAYAQADAPAWLATAGAGDVLAGLLGALLAGRSDDVHDDPTLAAALAAAAALVHGHAADEASPGGPVSALSVARALPAAVRHLLADPGAPPA